MKHHEFYTKYKTSYRPLISPLFSKRNWWRIGLITLVVALIEPFMMYKYQRSVSFSLKYYLQLIGYFLVIIVPFVAFLLWVNWRESLKRDRGYGWIGKFEVIDKLSSFAFCYLLLAPGDSNKLRVNRDMFEKTRVGDIITIRRDALGNIEEVSKVNNFSSRVVKAGTKRSPKHDSDEELDTMESSGQT